jgi:hypothetical protein
LPLSRGLGDVYKRQAQGAPGGVATGPVLASGKISIL